MTDSDRDFPKWADTEIGRALAELEHAVSEMASGRVHSSRRLNRTTFSTLVARRNVSVMLVKAKLKEAGVEC